MGIDIKARINPPANIDQPIFKKNTKNASPNKPNTIDGTADRALRFNNVNETITIRNNTIKGVQEEDGELLKATSVTAEGSLVFENNTYDGNAWAPENVTTESTNVFYTITLA